MPTNPPHQNYSQQLPLTNVQAYPAQFFGFYQEPNPVFNQPHGSDMYPQGYYVDEVVKEGELDWDTQL